MWFVGQQGNYVAYLEPASGQFRRYELEEGAFPHNLIAARNGAIWYSANGDESQLGDFVYTTVQSTRPR